VPRLSKRCTFFAVELNPEFAKLWREHYPNLKMYNDSASNIAALCHKEGVQRLDVVFSGLPWASFPEELQREILDATLPMLKPGGKLITFAYQVGRFTPAGRRFAKLIRSYFSKIEHSEMVWRNIPPGSSSAAPSKPTKKKRASPEARPLALASSVLLRARVVVEALVHDLAVLPLLDGDLLHVHRLVLLIDEVHGALDHGDAVTHAERFDGVPLPFLHLREKLLLAGEVGLKADAGRPGVLLHAAVLGVELRHRFQDLSVLDVLLKVTHTLRQVHVRLLTQDRKPEAQIPSTP
jgi:hypothetical protein